MLEALKEKWAEELHLKPLNTTGPHTARPHTARQMIDAIFELQWILLAN